MDAHGLSEIRINSKGVHNIVGGIYMKERFAKLKESVKNFFKKFKFGKKKKAMAMLNEHMEEFEFFIKYYPVFVKLVKSVSEKELANLNRATPCKYRVNGETPFRLLCALKLNGEAEKKICECETCAFRE